MNRLPLLRVVVLTVYHNLVVMIFYSNAQPFQWFFWVLLLDLLPITIVDSPVKHTFDSNEIITQRNRQFEVRKPMWENRLANKFTYQNRRRQNHGVVTTSCKWRQFRVTYARPPIIMYAIGNGNKSNVPIMDDHLPVTISTVNTNDMLTIDIDTKPNANRNTMYGINVWTKPSAVPAISKNKTKKCCNVWVHWVDCIIELIQSILLFLIAP